ncbi:hypothetical protein GR140_30725 (plasmid) [Pseudomonas putida]|uniref:hypothetical protein n=1 Tax=Pseudomonas putida TaxID=303 RepID=UPI001BB08A28|nr:hypothetical protein [Pseudomonas putida]QUG93140.1 hypothetical protein GR140_30725 [Pseudomonas putida]
MDDQASAQLTVGRLFVCKHLIEQSQYAESGGGVIPEKVTLAIPLMGNDQLRLPPHTIKRVIWAHPAADGNPSSTIGDVPLGSGCVVVAKPRFTPKWEWHPGHPQ